MYKAEKGEESYSNSEEEDELNKVKGGHKKPSKQKGSIKAIRQKLNDILGMPMGKTKFQDLDKRPDNDPFIAECEAQYNNLGKPTPRAITSQMSAKSADKEANLIEEQESEQADNEEDTEENGD
nr:hypothetical protein [Tanacetum cinerariifolium]